ncbi:ATP-dependent helicase/deoxyribonuclease subunit B [Pelotomaculum sp. FP]|uniref:helicase-exonuclease AddAB subunit AddB n=1 Tax=Pelotomaculum sp. FP TaxID=261474 RepID=UPI00106608B4|nr:helicase-exonuclease AddAB subunit AddB [Pelotomaculum sp. FP]TEB17302.1 ATP-dependent helicase/deoxyribonuclease subunit B [Pelotomaculum sp. FP]
MSIRFIIGRAGTGKTRACLDAVREELLRRPAGPPLILLVPEQATFQTEYSLASTPGLQGFIRAQALSFRRLAYRVLQEVGGAARAHIGELGKRMLLRRLLDHRKGQLKAFRRSASQPGFTDTLARALGEMKTYCVGPAEIELALSSLQAAGGTDQLADKLEDLSLLFSSLEEALADRFTDPDDYLNLLADRLERSEAVRGATVWVDGFSGFTPQEYRVLAALARTARQVNITLCAGSESLAGKPEETDLFYPIRETYETLAEMAVQEKISVERPLILDGANHQQFSSSIAYLEKHYFNWLAAPKPGAAVGVTLAAAAGPSAEVEGVAREITALCRDQGFRYRDIGIILRDLGAYADLISIIFTDHGIPFFIDQKRQVMSHPLVELVRSALETAVMDWSYNPVFRFLKTDLAPVSREEVDLLENYVLAHGIRGSRWTDGKPWTYRRLLTLEEEQEVTELEAAELEAINRIRRRAVVELAAFTKAFNLSETAREKTAALYSLLEAMEVPLSLESWSKRAEAEGLLVAAREHAQVWSGLVALLDQVVETLGDEVINGKEYSAMLDAGLESMRLGLIPPALDQVMVGSLERSRSPGVKVAFVMGVSDGVLPARLAEQGVLTEAERERLRLLGLNLAPGVRRRLFSEQYLVYIALTRASERLYLSSPLADDEGGAIMPSQVLARVRELLPGVEERIWPVEPDPSLQNDLEFVTNKERSLSYLASRIREARSGIPINPLWWDVYSWFAGGSHKADCARVLAGLFYSNREGRLPAGLGRLLYGRPLRTSVSGVEKFRACPFAHFLSHGLKLRERAEFKLDAPDVGQFFHAALKLFGDRVSGQGIEWGQLTLEQCRNMAGEVVDLLAPRLQSEILLSSARSRYITGKLRRIVQRAAQVLCEHSRRGRFQPVGLELYFGPDGDLPAVTFTLRDGSEMLLTGRIDRIDAVQEEGGVYLRVIDYKSGKITIDLPDIYHGLRLQLLAYLDVALLHAQKLVGGEGLPGAVLYFRIHDPLVKTDGGIPQEGELEKKLLQELRMTGMVLADPRVVKLMDDGLGAESDLIPVRIKKDGAFAARSAVLTAEQFELLRAFLRAQLISAGSDIVDGVVDIAPLRRGTIRSCRYCPFKPVCQFDILIEGNTYKNVPLEDRETIWRKLAREARGGDNGRKVD